MKNNGEIITDIIIVKNLVRKKNLKIPDYQRPYKWTEKNVNQLIDDIIFHKDKSAYRLGTLVLHKDKDNLNIVDGQQRTITLILIAKAITNNKGDLLEKIFEKGENKQNYTPAEELMNLSFSNDISKLNIKNNYKLIERRISDFDKETINFLYNKCELVIVILEDISEAFQFFDSQNARGKDLEPHDLLKAFHLREMNNFLTEKEKIEIVKKWEEIDTEELSELFARYLYRIKNWIKGNSARYFSKNDIDVFKGISPDFNENYPFTIMYRIAHYYTDYYDKSHHKKITGNTFSYPFQLDQVIINGKRFFEMIFHYHKMISEITTKNDDDILEKIKSYDGSYRVGDKYVRDLFYCALIYYIDKFGEIELPKVIEKIFIWAYTLRLKLASIGIASIDNYALNKAHSQIQLFKLIRDSISPKEIINLQLEILDEIRFEVKEIEKIFIEKGYYNERKAKTT